MDYRYLSPLRNVSYNYRYYEEARRKRVRLEQLEEHKAHLEHLITSGGLDGLLVVAKDGTTRALNDEDLRAELKTIKTRLKKLKYGR